MITIREGVTVLVASRRSAGVADGFQLLEKRTLLTTLSQVLLRTLGWFPLGFDFRSFWFSETSGPYSPTRATGAIPPPPVPPPRLRCSSNPGPRIREEGYAFSAVR